MLFNLINVLIIFCFLISEGYAQTSPKPNEISDTLLPGLGSSASGAIGTVLASADVALTKSTKRG